MQPKLSDFVASPLGREEEESLPSFFSLYTLALLGIGLLGALLPLLVFLGGGLSLLGVALLGGHLPLLLVLVGEP